MGLVGDESSGHSELKALQTPKRRGPHGYVCGSAA